MNGWQRLWVVVAVIWGLGVVAVGYTSWTEIETRKAIAGPQSLRDRVIEMLAHNVSEDVIVTFINKYDADNNASAAKRQVVWQSAAWGAVPLIVLYGLGWAFAWVRRGFRPAA